MQQRLLDRERQLESDEAFARRREPAEFRLFYLRVAFKDPDLLGERAVVRRLSRHINLEAVRGKDKVEKPHLGVRIRLNHPEYVGRQRMLIQESAHALEPPVKQRYLRQEFRAHALFLDRILRDKLLALCLADAIERQEPPDGGNHGGTCHDRNGEKERHAAARPKSGENG